MKRIIRGFVVWAVMAFFLGIGAAAAAVDMTVGNGAGTVDQEVRVDVAVNQSGGIAGASFTVAYDTAKLILSRIESQFFATFKDQWDAIPVTGRPISETVEATEYFQPLMTRFVDGTGTRVSAARAAAGPSGTDVVLFSLFFQLKNPADFGVYTISVVSTQLDNPGPGYATSAAVPMLVGADPNVEDTTDPLAYPVLLDPPDIGTVVNGALTYNPVDDDSDGFTEATGDCNDNNGLMFPGALETCNGIDDDCDGQSDEGVKTTYYRDSDSDGFGANLQSQESCSSPAGYVLDNTDCSDAEAGVHPGAAEICGDRIDQDCSGADLSCDDVDNDSDGYTENQGDCDDEDGQVNPGKADTPYNGKDDDCNAATPDDDLDSDGYNQADECNDGNAAIHPGAAEVCGDGVDQDCSGADLSCDDVDNDSDGYTENQGDCDDGDVSVNPGEVETPYNAKDDDCNAATPDDDLDSDGYNQADECNDGDAAINPGATEICDDGIDQDCNGADLSCDVVDDDSDGYSDIQGDCDDSDASVNPGKAETPYNSKDDDCNAATPDDDLDSDGYNQADECNDGNAAIHPGAAEVCGDGVDQDCSGADLSCDDMDNDSDGYTENQGDCDDGDVSVNPGEVETPYNAKDDDCNAATPDYDLDSDGYNQADECNDGNAAIHPGAAEVCGDGVDQDCSGADLSCDDVDNDSDGYTENQGDCDDADGSRRPGAAEICNGIDDDCDGLSDMDTDTDGTPNCVDDDDDGDGLLEDCDPNDQDSDGINGADGDADSDGFSNDEECNRSHTSPTNGEDFPERPEVFETLPGSGTVAPKDTSVVIRVRDNEPGIDPDSGDIEIKVGDSAVFGMLDKKPVYVGDPSEYWYIFRPYTPFEHDKTVVVTVGEIADLDGLVLKPSYSFTFQTETEADHDDAADWTDSNTTRDTTDPDFHSVIGNEGTELEGAKIVYDADEPVMPRFEPNDDIPPLDKADGVGVPMTMAPPTIFENPVTIFIPTGGQDPANLRIYYYEPATGWVAACDKNGNVLPGGDGWMVPGSRANHGPGDTVDPNTIEIRIWHFSTVQAGEDDCPDDPNKTEPGQCGCGTPDTDTDSDGTADCNDNCPGDSGKTQPGVCGCGTADTDTDSDGTADCNDNCPNDPNKVEPCICGCGTPDTDTDSDGTKDCHDGCLSDPAKTEPGICGCGTPDTDTDSDGTEDCHDGCLSDPAKTDPGICGCGTPDTDTDSDGTKDCDDGCLADPAKTDPGVCGCGTPDTDADSDGVFACNGDCNDADSAIHPGATEICGDGIDQDCSDADLDCPVVPVHLTVGQWSGASDQTAEVNISVDIPEGISAAAFTITYDTQSLTLTDIQSDVFSGFEAQWDDVDPPSDLDPGSLPVEGYVQPLLTKTIDGTGTQVSAARIAPAADGDGILFTLTFTLKPEAVPGVFPIGVIPTQLTNAEAGYPISTSLPMLTGSNTGLDPDDPGAYPVMLDTGALPSIGIVENGRVTFDDCPDDPNKFEDGVCGCGTPDVDADSDGVYVCQGDCNDADSTVHPGAEDICGDGIDQDCSGADQPCIRTWYKDADSDGYSDGRTEESETQPPGYVLEADLTSMDVDCNDADAAVHPGAAEICNTIDDDCDTLIDDADPGITGQALWYADADSDGYGNPADTRSACTQPGGYIAAGGDCNDADSAIHPGATEVCNTADDDCDGAIDEGVTTTYYQDADSDGFGNPAATIQACSAPAGYVTGNTDCNDGNSQIRPGATEICGDGIDQNCNGSDLACPIVGVNLFVGQWTGAADQTAEVEISVDDPTGLSGAAFTIGYDTQSLTLTDIQSDVFAGFQDQWNSVDPPNELDPDSVPVEGYDRPLLTKLVEGIGTMVSAARIAPAGAGNEILFTLKFTLKPGARPGTYAIGVIPTRLNNPDAGYSTLTTLPMLISANPALDPADPGAYAVKLNPAAIPAIGTVTNGSVSFDGCPDDPNKLEPGVCGCGTPDADADSDGVHNCQGDCNDSDSTVYPGAEETCEDGIDQDCDGQDQPCIRTWYKDSDSDGYSDGQTQEADTRPEGHVLESELTALTPDCNDADPSIHPDAAESCNTIDDDCDGDADEGVKTIYYMDADSDGFGDSANSVEACFSPEGYADIGGDCNDANPSVHPTAAETCNDVDDNCDGAVDEGVRTVFYRDADSDGFGDNARTLEACTVPEGYVEDHTDCRDNDPSVHPDAAESCNGIDDNCDGTVDEGVRTVFYRDADSDGFGDNAQTLEACTVPEGYVEDHTDCNDADETVHPDADEICGDGMDQDCDGSDVICPVAGKQLTVGQWTGTSDQTAEIQISVDNPEGISGAVFTIEYDTQSLTLTDIHSMVFSGFADQWDEVDPPNDLDPDTLPIEGYIQPLLMKTIEGTGTRVSAARIDPTDGDGNDILFTLKFSLKEGAQPGTYPVAVVPTGILNPEAGRPTAQFLPILTGANPALDTDNPGAYPVLLDTAAQPAVGSVINGSVSFDDCPDDPDKREPGVCGCGTADVDADSDGVYACQGDCNDSDASIYPGAVDSCENGIDQDCDGVDPACIQTWYKDADSDGYSDGQTLASETQPEDYVLESELTALTLDCNDADQAIHPDAPEVCNGEDDDCDGLTDDDDPGATGQFLWYADADSDGYGNPSATQLSCTSPARYTDNGTDCDDTRAGVNPGGIEVCNGLDDDCDGAVDEGVRTTYYRDADSDGFGDNARTLEACTVPEGYVEDHTDCNDEASGVFPGAEDICGDGIDQDCNGADPACPLDGVALTVGQWTGGSDQTAEIDISVDHPQGISGAVFTIEYDTQRLTLTDIQSEVFSGFTDQWDEVDPPDDLDPGSLPVEGYVRSLAMNTIDGTGTLVSAARIAPAEDGDGILFTLKFALKDGAQPGPYPVKVVPTRIIHPDAGYAALQSLPLLTGSDQGIDPAAGDAFPVLLDISVSPSIGSVTNGTLIFDDCPDDPAKFEPGICGCGTPDLDADSDGYYACTNDCNDADNSIYPGAAEVCGDGIDQDCSGQDLPCAKTWYKDADGDGYSDGQTLEADTRPQGYVEASELMAISGDCDDADAAVNPGIAEVPGNGKDDDCNPATSDDDQDSDGIPDGSDVCPGHDDHLDADSDGVPNGCDLCPGSNDTADADSDGVPDGCDNCPAEANPDQTDDDGDDVGNACDLCTGDDESGDCDSDGICNNRETDDDNDGMSDAWENLHGFDVCDPTDANDDPDNDGFTNLEEFLAGTLPDDDEDRPDRPEVLETHPYDGQGIADTVRTPRDTSVFVRIHDESGFDLESGANTIAVEAGGEPVQGILDLRQIDEDNMEYWMIFRPEQPFDYGVDVDVIVNAADESGIAMEPYEFSFRTETEDQAEEALEDAPPATLDSTGDTHTLTADDGSEIEGAAIVYDADEPVTPRFGPVGGIPALDVEGVEGVGFPVALEPPTVFTSPVTLFIPCPDVEDVSELSVYYYNPDPSIGWMLACDPDGNVQAGGRGWMVEDSRIDHNDTDPKTIEIQVTHFSAAQAAGEPEDDEPEDEDDVDEHDNWSECFISSLFGK